MSDTFDWAGLWNELFRTAYNNSGDFVADLLRTRIEAAFVPRKQPLHCETCGTGVTEVLCAKCGEWWRDNSPEVHEATARAEAAEARVKVLEEALGDLMSWFPDKPSPPEWRLRAGERGADDAVEAARQALGAEHGK